MNLLDLMNLNEDDNIETLMDILYVDEDVKITDQHQNIDPELQQVVNTEFENEDNFYRIELYKTMVQIYQENYDLKKRIDILATCNDLLKNHVSSLNKNTHFDEDELDYFSK